MGLLYSIARLMKKQVGIVNSRFLNAAGRIKTVMFDKTGTLTQDSVDLEKLLVFDNNRLQSIDDRSAMLEERKFLIDCMATCHTLLDQDGKIFGDSIELALYEKSLRLGAVKNSFRLEKLFEFSPTIKRMSVLVEEKSDGKSRFLFSKGAPELLLEICSNSDYEKKLILEEVEKLSKAGLRPLLLAFKKLNDEDKLGSRSELERNLRVLGVAFFDNPLKAKTYETIETFKQAGYEVAMVTGDSKETAVTIAQKCGILSSDSIPVEIKVDRFSGALSRSYGFERDSAGFIDGANFSLLCQAHKLTDKSLVECSHPDLITVVKHVKVYARMTPEQKSIAVSLAKSYWRRSNCTVAYCGDGANDTLALQASDVGVCLSKAEGALISSFLSANMEIDCMKDVAIEGKAALTTNFENFNYFCSYSIAQTFGMMILFVYRTEYTNSSYIILDILIALNLCNCIGLLKPSTSLQRSMPRSSLLYWEYCVGILLRAVYTVLASVTAIYIVRLDPGYKKWQDFSPESQIIDLYSSPFEKLVG